MFKLIIENKQGRKLNLSNSTMYQITNISGLNSTSSTINSNITPGMDGGRFNSSRLDFRNLVLSIKIKSPIEQNRVNLYSYLKPKERLKIYYKNKNRDVYIEGYIENTESDLFTLNQTINVSILCLQPYFKAVNEVIFDISQVLSLFEFPFEIEEEGIEFSTYDKTLTVSIINSGDIPTGAIIKLSAKGNVINPIIYNADTREHFKLNFTMILGDLIKINTIKGSKSITLLRNGITTNLINYVDPSSRWFEIDTGDNLFTYECDNGGEYFYIRFFVNNCYQGV